jgi:hypothetical protein
MLYAVQPGRALALIVSPKQKNPLVLANSMRICIKNGCMHAHLIIHKSTRSFTAVEYQPCFESQLMLNWPGCVCVCVSGGGGGRRFKRQIIRLNCRDCLGSSAWVCSCLIHMFAYRVYLSTVSEKQKLNVQTLWNTQESDIHDEMTLARDGGCAEGLTVDDFVGPPPCPWGSFSCTPRTWNMPGRYFQRFALQRHVCVCVCLFVCLFVHACVQARRTEMRSKPAGGHLRGVITRT